MSLSSLESRICPQCGEQYWVAPRWRPGTCPSCHGQKIRNGFHHDEPAPDETAPAPDETATALAAVRTVVDAMDPLDARSQRCVMAWLQTRYEKVWP